MQNNLKEYCNSEYKKMWNNGEVIGSAFTVILLAVFAIAFFVIAI